ncbi:MAG: efflux RND transporter periplasmic adaptor subunit [Desulfobacteraceae bacterium]|nr:efflux RND transporter periplasmic adaptor subunit [Desulfobacteraceae bacterium]
MEQKTKKRLITSLVIIFILFGTIILLGALVKSKAESLKQEEMNTSQIKRALTNVITMEVIPSPVQETINLPGSAKPWKSLTIVAEVRGKIVEKKITEGTNVKVGDILAVIDKRDYENSYNAAVAAFEAAKSSQKRLTALKKKKFITQSQLDDITATVKQAKATMDNAKLSLTRCTIISPMDGIADKVFIENGTFLSSGDPVTNILQIDKIKIEVGIPESDVDVIRELAEFDITIDALKNRKFKGKRYYLYNTTDNFARLYNLEISVDNSDNKILPGMFARVKIVKHYIENGLAVPMYSLVNKDGVDGVYVVENNVANFRKVKKGFLDKWRIQIEDGLKPHDQVVVVGQRLISDKEKVNVTKSVQSMEELSK